MPDIALHRREYAERRFTVIDDVMPAEWCDSIAARAAEHIAAGEVGLQQPPSREGEKRFVLGPYRFHMIVGSQVRRSFPELDALYRGWCPWLSEITGERIIVSPHLNETDGQPSDVFWCNIKAYRPGDELDWHQDRNPLACILYLSDCGGGALRVRRDRQDPGCEHEILPRRGRLALVNGQYPSGLWHRAEPPVDATRYASVMSYFTPDNTALVNWSADNERSIINADKTI